MSEFGFKGSLPLVSLFDSYIVVSLLYVQFREYVCTAQIRYELCNEWQWVLVLHRMAIKLPVVLYQLQFAILFLYEEEWGRIW
jgi:hypothetical protein